jgi:Cu2+-exporting ATPase
MLTGEAIPVLKQPGDLVAAGTLNQTGTIALRATRTGKETTLAHIIALVEAAQTRKAPIQNLADTVAGYFTYGVMTIALVTFLFWYLVGSHLWGDALMQIGQHTMGAGHTMSHCLTPYPSLFTLRSQPQTGDRCPGHRLPLRPGACHTDRYPRWLWHRR